MQYFQGDFLKEYFPIASVNLFISSPPMDVLNESLVPMFGRILSYMHPDGWIFIDMPAGYLSPTVPLYHVGEASGWHMTGNILIVKQAWLCEDHVLHGFRRYRPNRPEIDKGVLEQCGRPKSHRTEFDPKPIQRLIDFYSEVGDVVLDGFCGTGTVPGEAEKMGRIGIGVDVRPQENIRNEYQCLHFHDKAGTSPATAL